MNNSFNGTWGDAVLGRLANANALGTTVTTPYRAFRLVPTPSHGVVRVVVSASYPVERVLRLVDALGRPVRTLDLPAHCLEARVDLSDLPSRLYHLSRDGLHGQVLVD